MKKLLIYGGACIAAVALIVVKLNGNKQKNEEQTARVRESLSGAVPVLIDTVAYTSFDQSFTANGNFEALEQIELTSEVSGRIRELYVREGSAVRPGQVLAKVDNEILRADQIAAQAKLTQSKQDLARYEQALASGGVTQKQVDDMRLQVETAQAQYVQANKNLNNAMVKSPVGGVINERFVETGTYLALGTKLFDIVDISRLKLSVKVSEFQVIRLKTGDKVTVTASVYPEARYDGTISFIAAKGDASLNYTVEVEIKNIAGKELKAGMYGTAHFTPPTQGSALLIPRSAFQAGVNSNRIFLADNGKAKLHTVVAGRSYGDLVEIREGLKARDLVITSGQINLADGTAIVISQ
jgi:membrane fusion protein, multidrug efflux system